VFFISEENDWTTPVLSFQKVIIIKEKKTETRCLLEFTYSNLIISVSSLFLLLSNSLKNTTIFVDGKKTKVYCVEMQLSHKMISKEEINRKFSHHCSISHFFRIIKREKKPINFIIYLSIRNLVSRCFRHPLISISE
jgi:hypothetical protein